MPEEQIPKDANILVCTARKSWSVGKFWAILIGTGGILGLVTGLAIVAIWYAYQAIEPTLKTIFETLIACLCAALLIKAIEPTLKTIFETLHLAESTILGYLFSLPLMFWIIFLPLCAIVTYSYLWCLERRRCNAIKSSDEISECEEI